MSVLAAACARAPAQAGHAIRTPGPGEIAACTVRETSRDRLVVEGGRPLYVEADAFVANGRGDVLLAGTPNYLWQVAADGRITGLTEDSLFGAVIARDGSARAVPAPIAARQIHGIRAAAREDHGWDVVFAEVAPFPGDQPPEQALRFWHGVYDGDRWSSLQQISTPAGSTLHSLESSSLVRHGDSLSWALLPTMRSSRRDIVLVQRRGGAWSHEAVATGGGVGLDLSYSDSLGLLLAVVQADRTLERDGNSLLLWARRPGWRVLRRVVHGAGEGQVHHPSFLRVAGGFLASWTTPLDGDGSVRNEMRATVGRLDEQSAPVVVLDPDVSIWSQASPSVLPSGAPLWVAVPENAAGALRVLSVAGGSAVELGRLANPYRLRVAAVAPSASQLLVTGMEYSENRYAFSLLLRARIECRRTP